MSGSPSAVEPHLGPGGTDEDVSEEIGFGDVASGFGPAAEIASSRFDMPAGRAQTSRPGSAGGPGFRSDRPTTSSTSSSTT